MSADRQPDLGHARARLEREQLRKLKVASLAEAGTLLLLLFIAVPLKRLAGWPVATSIMGPIHGLAFLAYCFVVVETVAGGGWSRSEFARLLLAAFVPFGGFANLGLLRRKEIELAASPRAAS